MEKINVFRLATINYCFRFHTRDDPNINDIDQDTLTYGGLLKQQFECDMYIKVEEQRLKYIKNNKKTLKVDTYSGLADAVAANEHRQAGRFVVLPATFTGGRDICTNSTKMQWQSYENMESLICHNF